MSRGEERRRHVVGVHQLERFAPENARAVEYSAVGQRLCEAKMIADGAEQTMAAADE
jgi:hypothetical protein